jgi:hypothetical protein
LYKRASGTGRSGEMAAAHSWVDGSYNVLFAPSSRAAVEKNLIWIRDKGEIIGRAQFQAARLADLRGVELLVHYRDRKTSIARTCKTIAAIRSSLSKGESVGIIYEITLDTAALRFAADERAWRSVVESFQVLPQ